MRISALLFALVLFGCGQQYIPNEELDGKVLCDSSRNCYKLEWLDGEGEAWRFKIAAKLGSDSEVTWIYIPRPTR